MIYVYYIYGLYIYIDIHTYTIYIHCIYICVCTHIAASTYICVYIYSTHIDILYNMLCIYAYNAYFSLALTCLYTTCLGFLYVSLCRFMRSKTNFSIVIQSRVSKCWRSPQLCCDSNSFVAFA